MYYLAVIQNNNTPALFSHETYDAALAAFHNELGYRAEGRTSTKCAILDSELVTLMRETWVTPVTDTEPVEG